MSERRGLGFFETVCAVVVGASLATIPDYVRQGNIENKVDQLLQRPAIELRTENVIGGNAPEKFYEIAGKRVYLEIDGQPVDNYVQNRE
ncbi:MAG: hypothetical protein KJ718_02545 [Nanoarchaeota archaeon]|nr:hypothetical protein [Nanoarchaeota archaeon]MBU1051409.1 hypothetical protein [Nanoarchaeota archaeon]MBU1989025.1 hypothetical protein [Nanoarchaeota archaeon]